MITATHRSSPCQARTIIYIAIASLLCLLISGVAIAQHDDSDEPPPPNTDTVLAEGGIRAFHEYKKRIEAAQNTTPLDTGAFGEHVSLYNGSTYFSVTDINLPGNNLLPVKLIRRLAVDLQPQGTTTGTYDSRLAGAGNWDVDVPYLAGTFPRKV